jgi:hypothetical protein
MKTISYGTVRVDNWIYTLTGEAEHTNRLLPAGYTNYHDANDDEVYDFEMSAPATGPDGTRYIVGWVFEGRKGDNDQELDTYDYTEGNWVEEAS